MTLPALARRLAALPASCGPVRLVGVDGHAGSGKSSFADRLAAALGSVHGAPAPVVHLDDLASHDALFAWTDRFARRVREPLSRGEAARFDAYDWTVRRFRLPRVVPPAPVVLVEGVGAGRRDLRPWLAELLWMDLDPAAAHARGEERDGPALAAFWRTWRAAEAAHFAADPSRPHAGVLVDGLTGVIRPLAGPAVPLRPHATGHGE